MSFLRPVSIFLRNALIKQHPYVSCCASCGEIKTPLGTRLCTSLAFPFAVDAVISAGAPNLAALVATLETRCPWLRRIVVITHGKAPCAPGLFDASGRVLAVAASSFMPEAPCFGPEAYLHRLPELGDYFLLAPDDLDLPRDLIPLDLFTPNGIPLLRVGPFAPGGHAQPPVAPGLFAHTKENAEAFLHAYAATGQAASGDYRTLAGQWLFAAARVVPVAVEPAPCV